MSLVTPSALATGKRSAGSPAEPPMTKVLAARGFSARRPAAPKAMTSYMRYKKALSATPRGPAHLLAMTAKSDWDELKAYDKKKLTYTPEVQVALRAAADDEEVAEAAAHKKALEAWASEWGQAAAAHLDWAILGSDSADHAGLASAIEDVESKATPYSVTFCGCPGVEQLLRRSLSQARAELHSLSSAAADETLVEQLRGADSAALYAHVKKVREGEEERSKIQAELDTFRAEKRAVDEKRAAAEAAALASAAAEEARSLAGAAALPSEVGRALQKQMTYVQGIKHCDLDISYHRGGVTQAAFAAAFGTEVGIKEVTAQAHQLGISTKALSYGGGLHCRPITLRLHGTTLSASAKYGM